MISGMNAMPTLAPPSPVRVPAGPPPNAAVPVDSAADIVFGTALPPEEPVVRVAATATTNICGRPFQAADGRIHVLDGFLETTVSPDAFEVCQETPLDDATRPGFQDPAFADDGTVFYDTRVASRIRALRDGHEVLDVDAGGRVSTSVALAADGRVVYGTADGRIHRLSPDGKQHQDFAAPANPRAPVDHEIAAPVHVRPGLGSEIFAQTRQGVLSRVEADGRVAWTADLDLETGQPPVLSQDGSALYVTARGGRFLALDARTGAEAWHHQFARGEGTNLAEPVTDAQGNVYAVTSDGTAWRFAGDGQVLSRIPTGQEFVPVNAVEPCIDVDAHGNICITPNCEHFMVYNPSGRQVADLSSSDLFREMDYIDSFSLSRDRTKAYVVAGAYSLAEVTLPSLKSPSAIIDERLSRQPSAVPPTITVEDDLVDINGVKVPKRPARPCRVSTPTEADKGA